MACSAETVFASALSIALASRGLSRRSRNQRESQVANKRKSGLPVRQPHLDRAAVTAHLLLPQFDVLLAPLWLGVALQHAHSLRHNAPRLH